LEIESCLDTVICHLDFEICHSWTVKGIVLNPNSFVYMV